jgi:hypothetical protein
MRTLQTIVGVILAIGLSLVYVDSAEAIRILMHGRVDTPTFGDDMFVFNHLEEKFGADNVDYICGLRTDGTCDVGAPADGSAAVGYDVVYLSSTMATSSIRNIYEDSPVGIVNMESNTNDDSEAGEFMLSDSSGEFGPAASIARHRINILDPSHPLAGGLSGIVQVFNDPPEFNGVQYGLGSLGAGVDLIADMVTDAGEPLDPPQHAIFAAEAGAALLGDGTVGFPATAAGRRVAWFLTDFGFFDLTADGIKLFDAAIEWAAADPAPALLGDYNNNGSVDAADYVLWRDGGTLANEVATPSVVTVEDYNEWRVRFGNVSVLGATTAVPEPAACILATIALVAVARLRRR